MSTLAGAGSGTASAWPRALETTENPPRLGAAAPASLASVDYWLLVTTCLLSVVGATMVYSASFVVAHNQYGDDTYFLARQLAWIGVGAVGLILAARCDYHSWRGISLLMMAVCILLLIAVLVPGIGTRSYGAARWIRLGSLIQIQPSELAKIALVVYLADWLARRGRMVRELGSGLLPFTLIVSIVAVLVEVQPDLGTTSIIIGTAACVFFLAGANLAHLVLVGFFGAIGAVAFMSRLSGYRQDRIAAFLDPWSDIQGSGWHTAQGLIAIGSGGPFGVGLGGSHQKFYWIPNAHTDAIFAIIGEELGFVGCIAILLLFGLLAWRGFLIAWRAPDRFGRLLATGLTSMLLLQALVNIAVVTNSVPYTGITLPFISFGGNSTVVSLLAVGLLLSVSRWRNQPREPDPDASPVRPRTLRTPGQRWVEAARPALGLTPSSFWERRSRIPNRTIHGSRPAQPGRAPTDRRRQVGRGRRNRSDRNG